jgi:glycosyltransferase involved in cell wall biosynthesis
MRIGIGAILGVVGGPATYARELIAALAGIDTVNEYVVISDAPERVPLKTPNVRCAYAPLRSAFLQLAWDHGWVPYLAGRHHLDLYHGTKGMLPLWCPCPQVVTVHDLAVYRQPETFSWLQRMHQRSHTPLAVRRAARVIAVSAHGRRDLVDHFRLSANRVVAIPLAASQIFTAQPAPEDARIANALALPARYVLYAGTIQPRKNVELLIEAFTALPGHDDVQLVIAGRLRPGYRPAALLNGSRRLRYLGPVTDDVLAMLYRRALVFCSPSSYEGFGLSLLEAMTSGCLVVAARNSAIPELLDGCGILIDELSVAALRAALTQALSGTASLAELRAQAQQRAARYTWQETARRTLAVYQEAIHDARGTA